MKTLSKISLVALCLAGFSAHSQSIINEFYHIAQFPADHAQGDKVITTVATETAPDQAYVVAGAAFSSELKETPYVGLYKYAMDGTPIFTKTFILNDPNPVSTVTVKGLVEATRGTTPGYGVLAFTNAYPQQSVLLKTDVNGNLLWKAEVGKEQAAGVAYDYDLNRFIVIQRHFSGFTADLQLVIINANTGAVIATRNYDGFHKSDDDPAAIVYDGPEKSYILVGTSTIKTVIGSEIQLMLTRTTNTGALVYTHTLGYFGVIHQAVDAVLLPNGFNSQVAIGGLVTGTLAGVPYSKQPAFTIVDTRTGVLANVNVIEKNFELRAITFIPGMSSLAMVGNKALTPPIFGTETNLFAIDPTDPAMIGSIHLYNPLFTTYAFHSIAVGAAGANLVSAGTHKFPFPWAGSPAGENYNWVTSADAMGNGECDRADTLSAFSFPVPALSNSITSVEFLKALVRVEEISQEQDMIDACGLPFRKPATPVSVNTAQFRLYPNPANTEVTLEYSVAQNDEAVLNLMDVTGRVVSSQKLVSGDHSTVAVNVADIASGVYYSDLRVNGQSVQKDKLVVQH